jgi:hypothetical protein
MLAAGPQRSHTFSEPFFAPSHRQERGSHPRGSRVTRREAHEGACPEGGSGHAQRAQIVPMQPQTRAQTPELRAGFGRRGPSLLTQGEDGAGWGVTSM